MSNSNKKSSYYQKSAFTLRVLKYAAIFLLVVFLISCIVIFRRDITIENIQLLSKFISFDSSSSDYGGEFSVTANNDADIFMIRNNLGIVSNNNISLYDLSGQKLFSYKYVLSSPAVVHDEHSIIVHDVSGKSLTIFNSFSKIKDFKYDGNVLSADINDNYFSVITQDESYNSVLHVYEYSYHERDYVEIFTLKSTDYLSSCGISHNGRHVITSSVSSHEGSFLSKIQLYDTSSNSTAPLYEAEIKDEMPVKVDFAQDNQNCYVITDSSVHFLDEQLSESSNYKFNQSKILDFYERGDLLVLTESNNLSGNSVMLIGITKHGDIIFENNVPEEVYDVCIGNEKVFALGKQNVYEYSDSKENRYGNLRTSSLDSKYFSIVSDTDDNCYVLNDSAVKKITF